MQHTFASRHPRPGPFKRPRAEGGVAGLVGCCARSTVRLPAARLHMTVTPSPQAFLSQHSFPGTVQLDSCIAALSTAWSGLGPFHLVVRSLC